MADVSATVSAEALFAECTAELASVRGHCSALIRQLELAPMVPSDHLFGASVGADGPRHPILNNLVERFRPE